MDVLYGHCKAAKRRDSMAFFDPEIEVLQRIRVASQTPDIEDRMGDGRNHSRDIA